MRTPHLSALVTGLALIALGVLLELEAGGRLMLGFAYAGPIVVVALGAILLAGGLEGRGRGRD
jgi:hypothetical protein